MAESPKMRLARPTRLSAGCRTGRLTRLLAAVVMGVVVTPALGVAGTLPARPQLALAQPATVPFDGPIATAVRVEAGPSLTRLVFSTTQRIEASGYVMLNPDRIIVDLPEVEFRLDPLAGRQRQRAPGKNAKIRGSQTSFGVVSAYRFGSFAAGKSRVVIDLAAPARLLRAVSEPAANGDGWRLVIELAPSDRASFQAAAKARPGVTAIVPAAPVAAILTAAPVAAIGSAVPGLPVIMLDPGHGGVDSGAHGGADTLEKDVVLAFATALKDRLDAQGHYRVVMTRSTDVFIPLAERVRMAREAGAALFVSIHADTLVSQAAVSGATVYTVSEKASDKEAARVAESENRADIAAGVEAADEQSDLNDILFELTRRETRIHSHTFARTLVDYLKNAGSMNKNPHRSAGFRVLKAPDVPSVLIELGYLSSRKDLEHLVSPEWREKAGAQVAIAVDEYFRVNKDAGASAIQRGADVTGTAQ